jgi:hypothetical protein
MKRHVLSIVTALVLLSIPGGQFVRADRSAEQVFLARLPLLAKPGDNAQPGGRSSAELIRAALERGEIDSETALIYRVFANFADPRLPEQYRGDDTAGSHDEPAAEVASRWAQLSAQTRAVLEPFSIPPYHVGSWWDLRRQPVPGGEIAPAVARICDDLGELGEPMLRDWQYLDSADGHVRIWWQTIHPEDAVAAHRINAIVERIWVHLYNLMKRHAPSDGGTLNPCRGGDDRLDISLVDIMNNGEVWLYDRENPQPGPRPNFMLLRRDFYSIAAKEGRSAEQLERAALIHELMHSFQFAFDMQDDEDYAWWREATGTWAIHYVEGLEPGWRTDYEHTYAPHRLKEPDFPLDFRGAMQYGAYLFPFFLQLNNNGNADFVRRSFERSEQIPNSLKNLNELIGGFQKQFPKYVLRNLNRPPVNDYQQADQLAAQAKFAGEWDVSLAGASSRSYELDGEVRYLASKSYRFTFSDTAARSVLFMNPFAEGDWPTASVQALVKIDGQWKEADWTARKGQVYCRDLRAERVEELIIAISNTEWQDREHKLEPDYPPRLNVTNVACRGWKFESDAHMVHTGFQSAVDENTHVVGTFERLRETGDDGGGRVMEMYRLKEAQATWTHTGSSYQCAGSGSGAFTPPVGTTETLLFIRPYESDNDLEEYAADDRRYHGYGMGGLENFQSQQVTYVCQGGTSHKSSLGTIAHWFSTETAPVQQISADGQTIKGSFVYTQIDTGPLWHRTVITYTWTMTALPPE